MKTQSFFKRVFKTGFITFWRSGVVSLASVLIMTVTLLLFSFLIFGNAVLDYTLANLKDKVDMTVYFYPEASQAEIDIVEKIIVDLPQVSETTFIDREQALLDFRERHKDDELTLQALDELSANPLGSALNVKAFDPSSYKAIAELLEGDNALLGDATAIIERVNYRDNQTIIENLDNTLALAQRIGFWFTILFVVMSIVITFNTIRLAIYSAREEIEIMRLVGADNYYIRGPFMVAGLLYGIFSALLTMIILYPLTLWISARTSDFFGGLSLYVYYVDNFFELLVLLLTGGAILGALASLFAISKYLKK